MYNTLIIIIHQRMINTEPRDPAVTVRYDLRTRNSSICWRIGVLTELLLGHCIHYLLPLYIAGTYRHTPQRRGDFLQYRGRRLRGRANYLGHWER